ncbi:MAG TPA: hypothetical protein VEQ65_06135, partial [Opitutus sp.]|nr:hypothetical protein [Opitutus sp.]
DLVPVDGPLGRAGGAAPGPDGRNVDHVCFRVLPWDEAAILAHARSFSYSRFKDRLASLLDVEAPSPR